MRKYFDFAQSLYLQNLIILYIYILCSLVCFPSLFIHRRLSMDFCNVCEATATAAAAPIPARRRRSKKPFHHIDSIFYRRCRRRCLLFLILQFARSLAFHFSAHLHGICLPCRPHITMPWHCWILLIVRNGEWMKNANIATKMTNKR